VHSSDVNPAAGTAGTGTACTVTGAGVGSWSSGGGSMVTSMSSNLQSGQRYAAGRKQPHPISKKADMKDHGTQ